MSTSSGITEIRGIVNSFGEEQRKKLNDQWRKDIEDSNFIISEIEEKPEYIGNNIGTINAMVERLNKELDYYAELGVDMETKENTIYQFPEIRRNLERNYRTLSLIYYRYNFEQNKIKYDESEKNLNHISEAQIQIEKKMDGMNSRIEGLGATFLNMVLTISITTTMVTVLTNVNDNVLYALSIVVGCAWILLTTILFIGAYFKEENKKIPKIVTITYMIITVLVIIFFVLSIGDFSKNKKIANDEAIGQNKIITVDKMHFY